MIPLLSFTCICFMEYQCFRLHLHLKLGIISILLAGITYCTHSSELGTHKYITEAYFHRHDIMSDHNFQDFITNELTRTHTSCDIPQAKHDSILKVSLLDRKLIGEGSHRRLTSFIKIKNQPQVSSCEAIVIERLPSGVFVDPFELQHLTQRGVFSDASVFGDTDLELPTARANRSIVEVHMDLRYKNKNDLELKIELPLHARYAPLGKGGYTRIKFGNPDLFLRCIIQGGPHNQNYIFSSTNDDVNITSNLSAILWEVPSGIIKHTKVVSMITFISAIVSAFSIFMVCIFYSNTNSKQS
ncbi:hypothetical protein L2E82_16455 [Cichorium intybus]|uniref:Uncharacterized protein n=1 Tax=Cichorium intybus TaxID=13427 RepID=A0ACB9F6K3_CICIN|nr:hypothetical protein L2E82_16455 [Cichorium intybus]